MIGAAMTFRWSLLLSITAGVGLSPILVPIVGEVYDTVRPVKSEWRVTRADVDGADLVVSGTMMQHRACHYVPPPRARDQMGNNYPITSENPNAPNSWMPSDAPQTFGPWRVKDGAGKRLTFYQQHRCNALWDTFTTLGTVAGE